MSQADAKVLAVSPSGDTTEYTDLSAIVGGLGSKTQSLQGDFS
jgi:hypothetical protein